MSNNTNTNANTNTNTNPNPNANSNPLYFSPEFRKASMEDTRSATNTTMYRCPHNDKTGGLSSLSSINNSSFPYDLDFDSRDRTILDDTELLNSKRKYQEKRQKEQKEQKEASPKETMIMTTVAWRDDFDRLHNFVTKKSMTPLELYSAIDKILQDFQTNQSQSLSHSNNIKNDSENSTFFSLSSLSLSSKNTFTYTSFNNLFLCKISSDVDTDSTAELSIGIYTYQEDKCLLDIRKLEGEHFTFTHFFENLKTILREQDIIDTPSIKKENLGIYGLDLDIGMRIFS